MTGFFRRRAASTPPVEQSGTERASAAQSRPAQPSATEQPAFVGHPERATRRRRPTLLIPLLVMAFAVATVGVASTQVSTAVAKAAVCIPDRKALVPATGALFGVNLDWQSETLAEEATKLGHDPAVSVQFSDIPYDKATWQHTLDAVDQIKVNGGIMLLTLEPNGGLDTISDAVIARLVKDLKRVNDEGVPVIVRFAHEMNGSWYAWGQQPTKYIDTFRRVSAAVHAGLPGTSMMWAPNYGGGYGFDGGQFAAKAGSADFAALDTNHDGVLTMADDPYAPYFPGDKYVDWVGVSLYHWGNQRPWGNNQVSEPGKFLDMLTGTYHGTAGDDSAVPDFYQIYGIDHHHPVAVPETAAIFTPSRAGGGDSELAVKQAWWEQVFSEETHKKFPDLKMINLFEWKKTEIEIKDTVDWRVTGTAAIAKAFRANLPSWLDYASDVSVCR